jgi:predicted XRE-type DNA-binding protein
VDREKRKILEAKGYKIYDHAGDAVGMSEDEKELMDLRIKLAMAVRKQREKLALSQQALADRIKTSQPRVAKIEKAASDVSLDQIIRAYAAVGGKLDIKGVGISGRGKVVKTTTKKKLKVARQFKHAL